MTTWLTNDQRAYLIGRYPNFVQAQNDRKTHRFWAPLYEVWWARWPVVLASSLVDEIGADAQAEAIARIQRGRERVRH